MWESPMRVSQPGLDRGQRVVLSYGLPTTIIVGGSSLAMIVEVAIHANECTRRCINGFPQ